MPIGSPIAMQRAERDAAGSPRPRAARSARRRRVSGSSKAKKRSPPISTCSGEPSVGLVARSACRSVEVGGAQLLEHRVLQRGRARPARPARSRWWCRARAAARRAAALERGAALRAAAESAKVAPASRGREDDLGGQPGLVGARLPPAGRWPAGSRGPGPRRSPRAAGRSRRGADHERRDRPTTSRSRPRGGGRRTGRVRYSACGHRVISFAVERLAGEPPGVSPSWRRRAARTSDSRLDSLAERTAGARTCRPIRAAARRSTLARCAESAIRSLWAEPRAAGPAGAGVARLGAGGGAGVGGRARGGAARGRRLAAGVALALALGAGRRCCCGGARTAARRRSRLRRDHRRSTSAAILAGGDGSVGLYTTALVLLLPYSLVRWGVRPGDRDRAGRSSSSALVVGIAADWTGLGRRGRAAPCSCCSRRCSAPRSASGRRSRQREIDQVSCASASSWPASCTTPWRTTCRRSRSGPRPAGSSPRPIPRPRVDALAVIEEEASRTLAEMRTMVGVLRDGRGARAGAAARGAPTSSGSPGVGGTARAVDGRARRRPRRICGPSLERRRSTGSRRSRSPTPRHARNASRIDVPVAGERRRRPADRPRRRRAGASAAQPRRATASSG